MTEAITYTIGAVSLAALLGSFNAWLERKEQRCYRQELALALAHRLMAWRAGDIARRQAKAEAMGKRVELKDA